MRIPTNLRRFDQEPPGPAAPAVVTAGCPHLARYLLASGQRDVAHEITRGLMPWARARVLEPT